MIDPVSGEPVMSFVAGFPIMSKGKVLGSGGTLLVTPSGRTAAEQSGLPHEVINLAVSKLYKGF